MKIITFSIISLTTTLSIQAQIIDELPTNDQGELEYKNVVELGELSKKAVYSKSKIWLSEVIKSSSDAIDLDDQDSGTIVVNTNSEITIGSLAKFQSTVFYTIKIECKDNKLRLTINISHYYLEPHKSTPAQWFNKKSYYKSNGKIRATNETYKNATLDLFQWIESSLIKSITKKQDDW